MGGLAELRQLEVEMHKANNGIGQPLVEVSAATLFVTDRMIFITMSGLISLVRDTLATATKE